MNPLEISHEPFDCPVFGSNVLTEITYRIHKTFGKKGLLKIDCNKVQECVVAISSPSGKSFTYDWDKCPKASALRNRGIR